MLERGSGGTWKREARSTSSVLHEKVTSKSVISRDAALAMSSKRTILTQECLRVILNCHELVGWERVTEHLNFFMASVLIQRTHRRTDHVRTDSVPKELLCAV